MAFVVKDRVRETSITAGTGTLTLAGAVSGFQTFATIGDGNTTYYCITDPTTGAWEVGLGTYTASGTTLSRDTVFSNSLGTTAKVSFAANIKDVFCTYPAERAVTSNAGLTSTQVPYSNADGQLINSANMTFDGTKLTVAGLKDSALTATRVTYAGASGELTDSANMTFDGTKLTVAGLKDSALTATRVTYAGASGELTDSANLTFDGTYLIANSIKDSALTNGRVTYAGASGLLQDNANLTFDGTTLTIKSVLKLSGSSSGYVALQGAAAAGSTTYTLPSADGTTGQFLKTDGSATLSWGSAVSGAGGSNTQVQYNSSGAFAGSANMTFDGTKLTVAGLKDSALTSGRVTYATTSGELTDSTNLTFDGTYLTANSIKDSALTSGRVTYAGASGLLTDSANLTYDGTSLTAQAVAASNGIVVNSATVSANYTIASGYNGMSAGPVSVNSGVTVTVSSGSVWTVI